MTAASSLFLANIPSPDRGVWEIGPIPIRAYALCIIAGIILAIWWGERRWVARGGTAGTVIDVAVFAVPFGLVGGRLYHVATDWYRYFGEGRNPLDALRIWDGGLGIWGAIALGGVGAWIGCRVKGVPLPAWADAIAPGVVTAQAIGRVGNYFNQELYGGDTTLPWGLEIYRRVNEAGAEDTLNGVAVNHIALRTVHPTFLYELVWNLLVAGLVVYLDRKLRLGHGRAFAVYVMGYTLGRTWIEMMRTDDATRVLDVRVNVWVSILVFLGAAVYFWLARSRGEREAPELLRGKDVPPPDKSGDEAAAKDADDDAEEAVKDSDADDDDDGKDATGAKEPDAEKSGAEKSDAKGADVTGLDTKDSDIEDSDAKDSGAKGSGARDSGAKDSGARDSDGEVKPEGEAGGEKAEPGDVTAGDKAAVKTGTSAKKTDGAHGKTDGVDEKAGDPAKKADAANKTDS